MEQKFARIPGIGSAHLPGFLEAKIAGLWLLGWVHATIETPGSHTRGALPPLPYHITSYHLISYHMISYVPHGIIPLFTIPHDIMPGDIMPYDIVPHDIIPHDN